MTRGTRVVGLSLTFALVGASSAAAQDVSKQLDTMQKQLQQQQQRIEAQQREIQQLRGERGENWLDERRTEEVKQIVREVLEDSRTRPALRDGVTGGHDGEHFYLGSADGNFLLNISGQVQARYTYNNADRPLVVSDAEGLDFDGSPVFIDDDNIGDQNKAGFEIPRAKIRLAGHAYSPRLTYAVQLNTTTRTEDALLMEEVDATDDAERDFLSALPDVGHGYRDRGGEIFLEDAYIGYEIAEGWNLRIGQFQAPFLREEAVSSAHQVAAERSLAADLMTIDYTQGIELAYTGELAGRKVRAAAMLHDGSYQANTGFDRDTSDVAIAGRGEVLLAGNWEQFNDFQAFSDQPFGLLVGAGIDWELGDRGRQSRVALFPNDDEDLFVIGNADVLKWTVDASMEMPSMSGLSLYAGLIGQHISTHGDPQLTTGADQFASILQASAFVVPDKADVFIRWEHLELDGLAYVPTTSHGPFDYQLADPFSSSMDFLTFGGNYYMHGNNAKLTLDLVWALDPMPFNASSQNLRADADDDQVAIRAQAQFLY